MGLLKDIGVPGVIIIVLGALLIFGPKRLPELGQSIGKMFSEFKKAVNHAGEEDKTENKNEKEKTKSTHSRVFLLESGWFLKRRANEKIRRTDS